MTRTIYCGLLREEHIGTQQTCCGWVLNKRDMGGVIFIDLRDREGILQVVCDTGHMSSEKFAVCEGLHNQSVIEITGQVRLRDADTVNSKIPTGTVELLAFDVTLISSADPLPFSPDDDIQIREDLRLKYRFLDLRRASMFNNLKFRHKVQMAAEEFLNSRGFICVETPMLCKSTPEGARDYLVPSRVHHGSFYALPQSPQIYKQLLMVGGIDRYYQVARCFRDEDLRADRQPEFTQVDMEMSFVTQEDVLVHLEELFKYVFAKVMGREIVEAFPRMTWHYCMDTYGSDKPDIRFGLPIVDLSDICAECSFGVFRSVVDNGGVVRAINVKDKADFTRTEIEDLTEKALSLGAKGMAWIAIKNDGELYSVLTKYFKKEEMDAILSALDAKPGDFILFCADKLNIVRRTLGGLRIELGNMLGLHKDPDEFKFLIVTDFPQFEWSDEENRFMATHHPFTMPYPEDVDYLLTDPGRVRAQAYDFVLNGIELGSGSVRIHDSKVQAKMFEALGFSDEEIENRFGFMVNAFRYGTPPHAGFAFGLDRLVMQLTGADSLREVIAFPKIKDASCPMTDAPTPVDESQLEILGLSGKDTEKTKEKKSNDSKKKSAVNSIDVDGIAKLARLTLNPEQKKKYAEDMSSIIDFANSLSAVDTTGVLPREYIIPTSNVMREDEVGTKYDRDEMLKAAKSRHDGYITVPKVIAE